MRRLVPGTLFGQTLLILLTGLAVTLLAGSWIYSSARQEAVRAVGGLAAGQRIANLARLVEEAPAGWRERLVEGSSDPTFQVSLSSDRPVLTNEGQETGTANIIAEFLRQQMPSREVLVAVRGVQDMPPGFAMHHGRGGRGFGPDMHGPMRRGPMMRAAMSWRGMQAAVQLADGRWLHFSTVLPDTGPELSPRLLIALLVMVAMIGAVTAWAVRRLTAPLAALAAAAERLGRDVDAPPLPETGSAEIRGASHAFNTMQKRLRRLVDNRTQMLAAISHDMRTQLMLLRLRAETTEGTDERDKLLATISEMEGMLTATLSFARAEAANETRRRSDLGALLASIVDDMADAGLPVTLVQSAEAVIMECKPQALRRAIINLIDNAIKYGGSARATLATTFETVEIRIDDTGPGIPEDELTRVTQPFYRLEGSRSRNTGGMGLGLAIAASVIEAHRGELRLESPEVGGLRASIILPR
jgi:signal transduction histidine kinase